MNLTDAQYERIALRLDGEDVPLDAREQAALDRIVADENAVAAMLAVPAGDAEAGMDQAVRLVEIGSHEREIGELLDVNVPTQAIDHAWRQTQKALARPQRRLFRISAVAGAFAAAAAAVLIVALAGNQSPTIRNIQPAVVASVTGVSSDDVASAEAYVESVEAAQDPAISLLAAEIDQLEADVIASIAPASVDIEIDQAEQAIEEFWLDESFIE